MSHGFTEELSPLSALRQDFLAVLPRVERHARFAFRHLERWHDREDAIAETIALAWAWYRKLAEQGKGPASFITTLAAYASRHVKAGRLLAGRQNGKDAQSETARQRHGFQVRQLQASGAYDDPAWQEALIDNALSPVPVAAAFRIDFPRWLALLPDRNREITEELAVAYRTEEVAERHQLSPARVSQLRRELHENWQQFHGERDNGHRTPAKPLRRHANGQSNVPAPTGRTARPGR